MKRSYLSGAAKKRKTKEDQQKISKLPKISSFFDSGHSASTSSNDHQESITLTKGKFLFLHFSADLLQ